MSEGTVAMILSNPGVKDNCDGTNNQSDPFDRLSAFIRLYCRITALMFTSIEMAFILENYADDNGCKPNQWAVAGQFRARAAQVEHDVKVTARTPGDRRRQLSEEFSDDVHRALAGKPSLNGSKWLVSDAWSMLEDGLEEVAGFVVQAVQFLASGMEELWGVFENAVEEIAEAFLSSVSGEVAGYVQDIANLGVGGVVGSIGSTSFNFNSCPECIENSLETVALAGAGNVFTQIISGSSLSDIRNTLDSLLKDPTDKCRRWTEYRTRNADSRECSQDCDNAKRSGGDQNAIRQACWCRDELGCPVTVEQFRKCRKRIRRDGRCGNRKCNDWKDVDLDIRYDSRGFDADCRAKRAAELADAQSVADEILETKEILREVWDTQVKGLASFTGGSSNRRLSSSDMDITKLEGEYSLDSEVGGTAQDFISTYEGSALSPDSTDMTSVESEKT